METPTHHVLVVANRTAATAPLLDRVRRRASRGPCAFTLLVPASPHDPAAGRHAHAALTHALPLLAEAADGPVLGIVEPSEPLLAVRRTLAGAHFDEVLMSTLPEPTSAWLRAALPARLARPWLPVAVVTARSDPAHPTGSRLHIGRRAPCHPNRRRVPRRAEAIALRDGAAAVLRPVGPDDGGLLSGFVDGLSEESSHNRFLGAKRQLTEAELRYLVDVDHRDHEALLALDRRTGALVGVARSIRTPHDAAAAEIAIVVADAWQGRGLGSVLLARLTQRARTGGIRRVQALVLAENRPALKLLRQLGPLHSVRDGYTVQVEAELSTTAPRRAPYPPPPENPPGA